MTTPSQGAGRSLGRCPPRRPPRLATPLLAALLTTCAAIPRGPAPADLPEAVVPHLEERALLLLLVDRQAYEPFTVERIRREAPELSEELAVALGQAGDPEGRPALEELLADPDLEVRAAAAFALGELEVAAATPALLRAASDRDREVGRLAVEALGKLGAPVLEVADALSGLAEDEAWARLLPSLFRFAPAEETVELAEAGLAASDPELHGRAAYALARQPRPEAAPHLRRLLEDPDPWVRGWAARGLGEVGLGEDVGRLRPLLDDPAAGPVIQALRAAQRLVQEGKAAAPRDWKERLLALFMDPRAGVRITALEAAGAWLRDSELSAALVERCERGALREREVALRALAAGRDPRAAELAAAAAAATEASLRAQAAAAAAEVGEIGLLEKLAADGEPAVRIAAFEGLLAESSDPLAAAHAALADPDPAVRATALDWLTEHPGLAAEPIRRAMAGPGSARLVDVRLSGVRALAARAAAEPLEREEIVAALKELARDADFLVRRDASQGLGRLGLPAPPVGPVETGKGLTAYRGIVQRTHRPREVVLTTEHGAARIRLACPQAPLTCLNFLQLVRQGFYDGLRFHRVVPDFVVQDGDPRGDGWGGPGYTIRDEINRLRYGEGVVGMALSGPDTGGSQFFVTLSAQPHLDGGYTAFGEVVAGMEVIRGILQGDRVLEAEEAEEAEGAREGEGAEG